MAVLKSLFLSVLIIFNTLSENISSIKQEAFDQNANQNIAGVIIPHHLLVESFMDNFYQKISSHNDYDTIFLISPNHFGYGYHYIQTTNEEDTQKFDLKLDQKIIDELATQHLAEIEPRHYPKEHGITVHINYLNEYFPKAKIIPLIIKNHTPQSKLDPLIEKITEYSKNSKTLIIASVDFSHYTSEEFALQNDERTIDWLKSLKQKSRQNGSSTELFETSKKIGKSFDQFSEDSVAIDSPESIYILGSLMQKIGKVEFRLLARTSTAFLTGITDPTENTSHLFGIFY